MESRIRISGKSLGDVAMPGFCPRCFWLKMRMNQKLPFQIFPGIFSSIDAYNKRIVAAWFAHHDGPPEWIGRLGNVTGSISPPHHSKFKFLIEEYNILLTGAPDAIFGMNDGSYMIADYKTSRYTEAQDTLYPMYETQLNAYALIGEQNGFSPISGLALIYMEPVTDEAAAERAANHRPTGFAMEFSAHIKPVPLKKDRLFPLLKTTRLIYDMPGPPESTPGCENCRLLNELFNLSQ